MKKIANKLRDMKVKVKLTVLSGILTISILLVGLAGIICAGFMNQKTQDLAEEWMPAALMVSKLNTLTSDYRIMQYEHMSSLNQEEMEECETELARITDTIAKSSDEYENSLSAEEDRSLMAEAKDAWYVYVEKSAQIEELSRAGKSEEAAVIMHGEGKILYDQFLEKIDGLMSYNEAGAAKAAQNAHLTYIFDIVLIIIVVILSIVLAAILSHIVTESIIGPLKEVHDVLGEISAGSLEVSMNYKSEDEFGELSDAINFFVDSLKEIITDEKVILLKMADGNFDVNTSAESKYIADYEPILSSMRAIKEKLGGTMERIAESTEQISIASGQMADKAQSLADGAAEQASTVEELVASVEEAASHAADSALQAGGASDDADKVRKYAENSNERMKEMIEAMDSINDTSKKISTIIQTIETIAAQTNLLSLNASIEAARAGEAGKGFAVVADEIGKLALQCSEAAGNTKNLIVMSINQVENGDRLAKDTAQELYTVTEGVVKIVEVTDRVKINCENQAAAMKEIDDGIDIISKVVESNSAAAEESFAASEELAAHAQNLQAQMNEFEFTDN